MKAPEYAEYVALGKERVKFVQSQTQGEEKPVSFIREKYSE